MLSSQAVATPLFPNLKSKNKTFPKNQANHKISSSSFLPLLRHCKSISELQQIHGAIIKSGHDQDRILLFQLLHLCSSLKSIDYADSIFHHVNHPDVYHYTALIAGMIAVGAHLDAIFLYSKMVSESIIPDAIVISYILKACGSRFFIRNGRQIHGQVLKLRLGSERVIRMKLLDLYGHCGLFMDANRLFVEMPETDVVAATILVSCYSTHGLIGEAMGVFRQVPVRDTVCWTAMIDGLVRNGRASEALNLFREMQRENVQPNPITIVLLLSACSHLGALRLGRWVDSYAEKRGMERNTFIGSALVDMYSKCGSLEEAKRVFDGMLEKDVISYNSMIAGLALHGRSLEAVELYREMVRLGLKPTPRTFVGVLNACSHGGLVDIGFEVFESMEKEFGLPPQIEHCGCMVDLLGRVGRLEEAYDFIQRMRVEPDHIIWGALLGACRIHGNLKLGENISKILMTSNVADSGTYILLANTYASFGKWEDSARTRSMMKERGIQKEPGCSLIEIDNEIYEFLLGDIKHPRRREIYKKLEEINYMIEEEGYFPVKDAVLHDIDDEEKQWALKIHSERLAICFGLISTKPGTTIRVANNLRVCGDCHSMIKLIAKVTGRKIVVRDRHRFHHFEEGSCSCGDYW